MKLKYKVHIFFCLIILSQWIACKKKEPCDYDFPTNLNISSVQIIFKDKLSNKYIYSQVQPLFNIDSIQIIDQFGQNLKLIKSQNLIPNTSSLYWEVNFGNIFDSKSDTLSFKEQICKDYIIKYNSIEKDTIKVCFNSKNTICGSEFEKIKVFYKEELIDSLNNTTFLKITINKI